MLMAPGLNIHVCTWAERAPAYFRLHGRNREAWLKKGVETSESYDYLYSTAELKDYAASAKDVSARARTVFVMFNNCRAGHAMKNALEILGIQG